MKKGYTLIELMIALAISALLVGLAVPRFTAYQQQLEFEQEARVIQECMQSAADQVAAPVGLAVGTSKLTVTLASTGGSSTCSYVGDVVSVPAASPFQVTSKVTLCSVNGTSPGTSITYDLPLIKHGSIQNIANGTTSVAIMNPNTFIFKTDCTVLSGITIATMGIPSSGLPIKLDIANT